ncbi:MAG: galactose-1-phosphate uridylyltransferase, partial [Candidatus Acidiferrum sp.]
MSGDSGGLLELQSAPHRRFNPLLREWILVSPHRTQRPWQGKIEKVAPTSALQYDPDCYLCPGNERAGGVRNPKYTETFVFDNDYPALLPNARATTLNNAVNDANLIVAESEAGICRVGCFSPQHDLTIASMAPGELRATVDMWAEQFLALEKTGWVRHVQIFENRGALMGASNPHPHCQIWANATVPNISARELESARQYRNEKKSCLLCDYLHLELKRNERVVCQNDAFVVVVPFWAVWPFETLVLSKRHLAALSDLSGPER